MKDRVEIRTVPSGVVGMDGILGGGLPEFSFNLIAGGPGCGKTTLAHQIMFANATSERRAIYFSIVGEPPVKMLRYQQQFEFFDADKLGDQTVRFVHLGELALEAGLESVLERIVHEVEKSQPSFVFVDSFRSLVRQGLADQAAANLQKFMQRLALYLSSWETTSFLIGEYADDENANNTIFTVADGILWLYQSVEGTSIVRKLQVMKMRGRAVSPGFHSYRISERGVHVFPRLGHPETHRPPSTNRLSTGVAGLDQMLGGGVPAGYSLLLAGPSGSGKTLLTNQFIVDGLHRGEAGLVAVFERPPRDYLRTTPLRRVLEENQASGKVQFLYLQPLDLSIDETIYALQEAVQRTGVKRAVIDSLSGLELALAPGFRQDFRESLYRMIGTLTSLGVTVMMTVDLVDSFTAFPLSTEGGAFLADAIVIQRYLEIDGTLRRAMAVVKVRASAHESTLREYRITDEGTMVVGDPLRGYAGLLTGAPELRAPEHAPAPKRLATRVVKKPPNRPRTRGSR